jgi:hypothetical protein
MQRSTVIRALHIGSLTVAAVFCSAPVAWSAGGTTQVVSKGGKVSPMPHWPAGLEALLNDPARGDGWNPWFSEWPNDVVHYQFEVQNAGQANRLIEVFSKIKSSSLHVRLALGKEPRGIGWVSKLEEGNNTAILFSMGHQERLNQWFDRLPEGKFGVMEFEKAPVAVPPTLTIFVQNPAIDLEQLKIPEHVEVSAGYVPGNFHIANLKPTEPAAPKAKTNELDAAAKKAAQEIEQFVARRRPSR